jgi:hypothetical protein
MIDKLFSTKVKITDSNRMLVEYCKQWVKTWCFELETKEEYDYSYNEFRKFMDSDRAKTEVGSVVAMLNKAEHRYQVKAYVSSRAIMATQLWSKSITVQSLTRIAEGLYRAQVTSKNNYCVKSMGQLHFFVVAKIVELNPNAIPGGRPQIVRLQVVKFEVDGSVCCSCDFFERVGIVCRHIRAIFHNLDESMVDIRWTAALGFYFGKPMYTRVASVIMQALESSLKKVKACIPTRETSYVVYSDGANEPFFSPFSREV